MKLSNIELAIKSLEAERAVLDLAIAKLKAQATKKPARVPRVKEIATS